jgi:hypothetical protein
MTWDEKRKLYRDVVDRCPGCELKVQPLPWLLLRTPEHGLQIHTDRGPARTAKLIYNLGGMRPEGPLVPYGRRCCSVQGVKLLCTPGNTVIEVDAGSSHLHRWIR